MLETLKKIPLLCLFLIVVGWGGVTFSDSGKPLATAAREQVGKTILYDPSYKGLAYPNGDVPIDRGVCSDVVIRAMRDAFGLDLQERVHEDMKHHFSYYPNRWGLKTPDKNIDHRRVPNLRTYFKRQGWELSVSQLADAYEPGDIVTCIVPPHLPHIMIISDKKNKNGMPYVIHNIGRGAREEDCLFEFELTGHYRIHGVQQANREDSTGIVPD